MVHSAIADGFAPVWFFRLLEFDWPVIIALQFSAALAAGLLLQWRLKSRGFVQDKTKAMTVAYSAG
jgi:hypothetical protein